MKKKKMTKEELEKLIEKGFNKLMEESLVKLTILALTVDEDKKGEELKTKVFTAALKGAYLAGRHDQVKELV